MNKEFDSDKGGMEPWVDWLASILKEVYRVLKPGAHGVVWALPRVNFWTGLAIHKAGFEVRDVMTHLFGSGFPKSHDVSKGIDRHFGEEREKVQPGNPPAYQKSIGNHRPWMDKEDHKIDSNIPISDEAKQWDGWGSALKPACEFYYLIRKPLSESTIAKNVLKHGVGGINIDENRISTNDKWQRNNKTDDKYFGHKANYKEIDKAGRWPSNLVLSHNPDCEMIGEKRVKVKPSGPNAGCKGKDGFLGTLQNEKNDVQNNYVGQNGLETVQSWQCTEGCPVSELDRQGGKLGNGYRPNNEGKTIKGTNKNIVYGKQYDRPQTIGFNDNGNASRFFHNFQLDPPFLYCSKPSVSERNDGLEGMPKNQQNSDSNIRTYNDRCANCGKKFIGSPETICQCEDKVTDKTVYTNENNHPTLKSTQLMRHLIKLITPKDGIVLDPFMGSGTTGVACEQLGDYEFIGIEKEADYFEIAKKRIKHALEPQGQMRLL